MERKLFLSVALCAPLSLLGAGSSARGGDDEVIVQEEFRRVIAVPPRREPAVGWRTREPASAPTTMRMPAPVPDPPAVPRARVALRAVIGEPREPASGKATQPAKPAGSVPAAESPSANSALAEKLAELRQRVRGCLRQPTERLENVAERTPWDVLHIILPFGVEAHVYARDQKVNAISWLCINGKCRDKRLFFIENGGLQTRVEPGIQGQSGQFLAILAQSVVGLNYPIQADGQNFAVQDLVEHEKLTCKSGTELSYKLIGLAHYLDSEATWRNQHGEPWSVERLLKHEIDRPLTGAPCGGSHRVMAISYALQLRELRREPVVGEWERAKEYVDSLHNHVIKLQNADGSLSTQWFEGRGENPDPNRRLQTTGHLLEWLVFSLPKEQLADARIIKCVEYLTELLAQPEKKWDYSSQGHALRALAIYNQRAFDESASQMGAVISLAPKME